MPAPIKFVATEKEHRILRYLFHSKVATFGQIHRTLFQDVGKSVVSSRLQRPLKAGLILKGITEFKGKYTQIFYLNPDTVDLLHEESGDFLGRYQAQSGAAEHDLHLNEIRTRLLAFGPVKKYWTENELQCLKDCANDPELRPFVHLRSDAVLDIFSDDVRIVTPLELEISRKANSRYEEKLSSYYERDRTICVLFISGSDEIQKAVSKIERQIVGERKPKFYYALLENVLNPGSRVEFRNLKGDRFVIE